MTMKSIHAGCYLFMIKYEQSRQMKSLRMVSPELYHQIISALEEFNIHSYDILLKAVKKKTGIQVILYYGQNFTRNQTAFFSFKTIKEQGDDLTEFINIVSDDCKKTMIDDYFNKMAP